MEEEGSSYVWVEEGAVDVNNNMVYDGESVLVGKDKKTKLNMRSLYVSHVDGIDIIRAKTHAPLKKIKLKETPASLQASKDGQEVYSVMPKTKKLSVINTHTLQGKGNVHGLLDGSSDTVLSPNDQYAYVSNAYTDTIQVIDVKSKEIVKTLSTGSMPSKMVVTHDGKYMYVTNRLDKTVDKIDLTTGQKLSTFNAGESPYGIVLSPEETELYVSDTKGNQILVFDEATHEQVAAIPVGDSPHAIRTDYKGKELYALNRQGNSLSIIDLETRKEIKQVQVGERPANMALRPEGDKLYVTNELSNNISLVDLDSQSVIQNIPTGTGPNQIVMSTPQNSNLSKNSSTKLLSAADRANAGNDVA